MVHSKDSSGQSTKNGLPTEGFLAQDQFLSLIFEIKYISLCILGWSLTLSPPASVSQVQGLQVINMPPSLA